jgi:hypothetical protein
LFVYTRGTAGEVTHRHPALCLRRKGGTFFSPLCASREGRPAKRSRGESNSRATGFVPFFMKNHPFLVPFLQKTEQAQKINTLIINNLKINIYKKTEQQ